jgi:Icc-related predicted phosphoesterase
MEEARVTICPWWDGLVAKEAVAAQLARDALKPRRPWIWVYHAPPADSPTSWDGRRSWGDADLLTWIETYRPDLVLSGHIHQAPFKRDGSWVDRIGDTWVFNSGQQIGPEPPHVIIDTSEPAAAWFSLAGAECVRLDQPLARPVEALSRLPAWLPAIPGPGPSPA